MNSCKGLSASGSRSIDLCVAKYGQPAYQDVYPSVCGAAERVRTLASLVGRDLISSASPNSAFTRGEKSPSGENRENRRRGNRNLKGDRVSETDWGEMHYGPYWGTS